MFDGLRSNRSVVFLCRAGQQHLESRSASALAVYPQVPIGLPHDSVADGESQSRTLASLLDGEKRLEDAYLGGVVHPLKSGMEESGIRAGSAVLRDARTPQPLTRIFTEYAGPVVDTRLMVISLRLRELRLCREWSPVSQVHFFEATAPGAGYVVGCVSAGFGRRLESRGAGVPASRPAAQIRAPAPEQFRCGRWRR